MTPQDLKQTNESLRLLAEAKIIELWALREENKRLNERNRKLGDIAWDYFTKYKVLRRGKDEDSIDG